MSVSIQCDRRFPQVMPSYGNLSLILPGKIDRMANVPCLAAMLHFPFPGGSRLPLDRQIRYYSETAALASDLCVKEEFGVAKKDSPAEIRELRGLRNVRNATPSEWRLMILLWPLASQVLQNGNNSLTVLCAVCPGWLSLFGPLLGGCSCRVLLF